MMHYCDKCLGTIPNHLPDDKICSRCVTDDELEAENKQLREENAQLREGWENATSQAQWYMGECERLREVLAVLLQELPPVLSPEGQVAWVRAERLLELLEEAREEIQNCYGRDVDLTERIWQALEGSGE